jgi:hypothetical protein
VGDVGWPVKQFGGAGLGSVDVGVVAERRVVAAESGEVEAVGAVLASQVGDTDGQEPPNT